MCHQGDPRVQHRVELGVGFVTGGIAFARLFFVRDHCDDTMRRDTVHGQASSKDFGALTGGGLTGGGLTAGAVLVRGGIVLLGKDLTASRPSTVLGF